MTVKKGQRVSLSPTATIAAPNLRNIEGLTSNIKFATLCSATMLSARKTRKPLSELEHLVMNVVWEKRSATAEDVRLALAQRHPMKESTVRTILKRLEDKGYVQHHTDGRTNVYRGVDAPQNVAAKAVRQIIERFCGGSVEQLLVGMVNDDVVDERELQRLAQRIARRKDSEEK
jgi:BlaI family penicillinase repressor